MKHPNYADALRKQLSEFEEMNAVVQDQWSYTNLVVGFEKVLDELEVELQSHGMQYLLY